MAQPQEADNTLVEKIAALDIETISPFELRRYQRSAEQLCKEDAAEGYMCLGLLAGIQKNVEEMTRCFDLAVVNDSASCVIYSNYGVSLMTNGLFDKSVEQHEKAIRLPSESCETVHGGTPNLVQNLAASLSFAGRYIAASEVLESHKVDLGEQAFPFEPICDLADFMKANGLNDSDLRPITEALHELSDSDPAELLRLFDGCELVFYDAMPGEATIKISVDTTPEEAADMQFDYAEALATKEYSPQVMDLLSVSFRVA